MFGCRILFLFAALSFLFSGSQKALAQDSLSIFGVKTGAELSYGICPCYRWTLSIVGAGGQKETKQFIISSDGLLQMSKAENFALEGFSRRLYTIGAAEVLSKGTRLGLAFEGVTFGEDRDYGYSDIVETGIYALYNLIRRDTLGLKIYSGINHESKRVNLGPVLKEKAWKSQALFSWNTNRWSSDVSVYVAQGLNELKSGSPELFGEASIGLRMFSLSQLNFGLGLDFSVHRDPERRNWGMDTTNYKTGIFLDVEWIR